MTNDIAIRDDLKSVERWENEGGRVSPLNNLWASSPDHPRVKSFLLYTVTGKPFRDELTSQNTSIALKANAMMSHPITSGRNNSTSELVTVKRFKTVMFNNHLRFVQYLLDYVQPRPSNALW